MSELCSCRIMRNSLFQFLSQYRTFWQLRSRTHGMFFSFGKLIFSCRSIAKKTKDSVSGLYQLFQVTKIQFISTILFAAFLQYIDPIISNFFGITSLKLSDDEYVTYLVTISGVGGVFIGLYYAVISTIGSSIYAKVPNNIRDLLAQELVGNVYMNFLSFTTFLGISFVSFLLLGFERIHLAVPVMLILAGVGIISFVKLGQRAFYFFDPTILSHRLFHQLNQYVKRVSAGGYRWNDANFQNHAYEAALSRLDALVTLSDITRKEIHLRGTPFISLSKELLSFLIIYEQKKLYIPSDSRWYQQKCVHRDWYRTEDYHVSIAHETGTDLQPVVSNNKDWVEDKVLPIIRACIEINLKEERYNKILELGKELDTYLILLARNGKIDRALNIAEELGECVLDTIFPSSESEATNEIKEKRAMAELFPLLLINISLACQEYIKGINVENIERKLSKINWSNDGDLYKHQFPFYCLPRLEWFKPRMEFELSVEGKIVTPIWYQKELLLQIEADIFVKNTISLIAKSSNIYSAWIDKVTKAKHPWLAASVISTEWEFWRKVDPQMEIWLNKWRELSNGRKIEGLPWANFEYETLKEKSKNRKLELLKSMSKQSLMLPFLNRPDDFPDYTGQFLHTSGEILFEALLNNDQDLLNHVFAIYLLGCEQCFRNLCPKSGPIDRRAEQGVNIAIAPLLDVVELSGYAKLMEDYHCNDQLWKIVTDAWDKCIVERKGKSLLQLFAEAIASSDDHFAIQHRGVFRTEWRLKISHKLRDTLSLGASRRDHCTDTEINHDSPLVRIFAQEGLGHMYCGIDIFIRSYFQTKNEAGKLNFGQKRQFLQESLDYDIKNEEKAYEERNKL